jgi:hypothetical protein
MPAGITGKMKTPRYGQEPVQNAFRQRECEKPTLSRKVTPTAIVWIWREAIACSLPGNRPPFYPHKP